MEEKTIILVEALVNGKHSASRLQNLLSRNDLSTEEIHSIGNLVMDITKSFADSLSVLRSCGPSDLKPQEVSDIGKETPSPLSKQGRGHYERRTSTDSRVKVSDTREDGYQWRKYGQKEILNSKFPRCYFRCTYKDDLGCMASKHVQQLENKTNKFRITYFGRHTCPTTSHNNHAVPHHDGHGMVLDFEAYKNHGCVKNIPLATKDTNIKPTRKRKHLSDEVSSTTENTNMKPRRLSPSLVSDDLMAMNDYPYYEALGLDNGDSSTSIISDGPLGVDIYENEDYLRRFIGDNVHDDMMLWAF